MRQTTRRTLTAAVVAERYRLEREMARGGMGTVWLAKDDKLGRHVAVKVMSQELAQMSEALMRFEREAQALAQLRSAHVVQVFDYGIQEGLPYIVMELLEGENLTQRLRRVGRLNVPEAIVMFQQVCKGLKAAHNAGLIHRDLKPSNIFIARRDDAEVVKLLDFGVVKAIDTVGGSEATMTGMLLGTPQYMSPEQARALRDIDHRSDLWSAAVIAFRMLTGQNPFRGESVGDVVLKICSDALPHIAEYRQDVPAELDGFFERAFQRDRKARFQSAAEMADELTRLFVNAGFVQPVPFAAAVSPSGMNLSRHTSDPYMMAVPSAPRGIYTSAPPTPVSSMVSQSTDATPISTTVAGTQLSSISPTTPQVLGQQPVVLVVAAAASLITLALAALIWLGSGEPDPGPAPVVAQSAIAPVGHAVEQEDEEIDEIDETAEDADAGAAASAATVDLDDAPPVATTTQTPAPVTTSTRTKQPTSKQPTSKHQEKSGRDKPDWGLGGK